MKQKLFRMQDIGSALAGGMNAVDMHFHSDFSVDSYCKVENIMAKARRLGIGVAIADHTHIGGCVNAHEKSKGTMVIPAVEVTSFDYLHTLFYFYKINDLKNFYKKVIRPNLFNDPYERVKLELGGLIRESKKFNAIVCSPHPYSFLWTALFYKRPMKKLLDTIDLIEAFNCSVPIESNLRAYKKAEMLGKGITGGSDGHFVKELGSCLTINSGENVKDFLDNVLDKKGVIAFKYPPGCLKLWRGVKEQCIHFAKSSQQGLAFARLKVMVSKSLRESISLMRYWGGKK